MYSYLLIIIKEEGVLYCILQRDLLLHDSHTFHDESCSSGWYTVKQYVFVLPKLYFDANIITLGPSSSSDTSEISVLV